MNRLFDKTIVLACCLTAAAGLPVDAGLVAAACAAVALCAFAEAARGEGALRASEAAAFAYIAASMLAAPVVPFSPLALYDVARGCSREHAWPLIAAGALLAASIAVHARAGAFGARQAALVALFALVATLLSLRTTELERERKRMQNTRDDLQERALRLEERNHDLASRQEYEVELATLAERARIAREIHDNVGHQLTRASLQAEALRVVHAGEPGVAADFADVKATVDDALAMVRSSVHALRDDSVDLGAQMRKVAGEVSGGTRLDVELDVACEHVPANVSTCFVALLRESLANTLRHSGATRAEVRCFEHPAFYQLVIVDNGGAAGAGGKKGAGGAAAGAGPDGKNPAPASRDGMGLSSMRERVEALGGSFRAGARADAPGWRVFASIPKSSNKSEAKA